MDEKTSRRTFIGSAVTIAMGTVLGVKAVNSARLFFRSRFVPPNAAQRLKAIGNVKDSDKWKRAFDPGDDFDPMDTPRPGEWLEQHEESGQTFDQFVRSRPNLPDKKRTTLYFVTFGDFDEEWSPDIKQLEACASAFFQMPVKTLPARDLDDSQFTSRMRSMPQGAKSDGSKPDSDSQKKLPRRQYLTGSFLKALPRILPADGYAILGMTMEDLYPEPSWNYVFGQASLRDRSGIYSFARYDPQFWGEERTEDGKTLLLLRSVSVLLHETCHMFGMEHCIYYRCLLNGSNSLEESDRGVIHLCPVCLRKLHHSIGFNITARDERLLQEYERLGFDDESKWLKKRLQFVKGL